MRRERPERAASPQPRATPWVPGDKALRPVRAKVWAHLLFITFALTGRRCGTYVNPGRCPGLRTCWAFSPRRAARMSRICRASAPERGSYLGEGLAPTSWGRFMNLAPVRGSYLDRCCGASPAHDMRPFQGQSPATLAASALKGQPVPSTKFADESGEAKLSR